MKNLATMVVSVLTALSLFGQTNAVAPATVPELPNTIPVLGNASNLLQWNVSKVTEALVFVERVITNDTRKSGATFQIYSRRYDVGEADRGNLNGFLQDKLSQAIERVAQLANDAQGDPATQLRISYYFNGFYTFVTNGPVVNGEGVELMRNQKDYLHQVGSDGKLYPPRAELLEEFAEVTPAILLNDGGTFYQIPGATRVALYPHAPPEWEEWGVFDEWYQDVEFDSAWTQQYIEMRTNSVVQFKGADFIQSLTDEESTDYLAVWGGPNNQVKRYRVSDGQSVPLLPLSAKLRIPGSGAAKVFIKGEFESKVRVLCSTNLTTWTPMCAPVTLSRKVYDQDHVGEATVPLAEPNFFIRVEYLP